MPEIIFIRSEMNPIFINPPQIKISILALVSNRKEIMISCVLKKYRMKNSLSMSELSKLTGLSSGQISDIENRRKTDLRLSTLIKLADVLDVSLDDLVGRKRIK